MNTLWWTNKKLWKVAIEIVDFPIKNGDFPLQTVSSPEGNSNCTVAVNLQGPGTSCSTDSSSARHS